MQPLADLVCHHIELKHWTESRAKSEVFNTGVIPENTSTIAGVIRIREWLHNYVPRRDSHMYPIVYWGDGLSCERHIDAQNARSNAGNPAQRVEGLVPSTGEFHKRMLLHYTCFMMEIDTMDMLFDGKSATDKGTLFHKKYVCDHRSVLKWEPVSTMLASSSASLQMSI
ncbi:hypothetical protein ACJMK2_026229 [Sinanodonta woodiana]|uniref:DUF6589 domain-containing protein n=1 Tax=Sinanodonta woodiana TaxID=1069815 RepID=A0ABD3XME9_SINWO